MGCRKWNGKEVSSPEPGAQPRNASVSDEGGREWGGAAKRARAAGLDCILCLAVSEEIFKSKDRTLDGDLGAAVRMIIKGIRVKRQTSWGRPVLLCAAAAAATVAGDMARFPVSVHYWLSWKRWRGSISTGLLTLCCYFVFLSLRSVYLHWIGTTWRSSTLLDEFGSFEFWRLGEGGR